MTRHAARRGIKAIGVTLSASQASWAQKAIVAEGLTDLAEVRHGDYRDIAEVGFDAVSSIGLTEHIGVASYPGYFNFLKSRLRGGGLLLNHSITRHDNRHAATTGPFIDRYVFPDGELTASGRVITEMQNAGFEVLHEENLRHHYAMTLRDWCANLVAHWDDAVKEVGLGTAKVWGLIHGSLAGWLRVQHTSAAPGARGEAVRKRAGRWVGAAAVVAALTVFDTVSDDARLNDDHQRSARR
jgi:cyclopropane-fatty-acyl-phospholipid synthase